MTCMRNLAREPGNFTISDGLILLFCLSAANSMLMLVRPESSLERALLLMLVNAALSWIWLRSVRTTNTMGICLPRRRFVFQVFVYPLSILVAAAVTLGFLLIGAVATETWHNGRSLESTTASALLLTFIFVVCLGGIWTVRVSTRKLNDSFLQTEPIGEGQASLPG